MGSTKEWSESLLVQNSEFDPVLTEVLQWLKECESAEEYAQAFAAKAYAILDNLEEGRRENRLMILWYEIGTLVLETDDDNFYEEDANKWITVLETGSAPTC